MNNGVVVVFIHPLKSRPNPRHRSHIRCVRCQDLTAFARVHHVWNFFNYKNLLYVQVSFIQTSLKQSFVLSFFKGHIKIDLETLYRAFIVDFNTTLWQKCNYFTMWLILPNI